MNLEWIPQARPKSTKACFGGLQTVNIPHPYSCSSACVAVQKLAFALLFGLFLAAHANGQNLLHPEEIARVNRLMDKKAQQKNALKCHIHFAKSAYLGFASRYHTGFRITTKYTELAPGSKLVAYIRVTPQGERPVFLGEDFHIPRKPPTTVPGFGPVTFLVNMDGSFDVGPGPYKIELLLVDERGRSFFKRWRLRTKQNGKQAIQSALGPLQVAPFARETWNGRLDPNGLRLTVLLDATAPDAGDIRLWNRDILLELLVSLLRKVPCRSVKIVAFNLDLQREVFTQRRFDAKGFGKLRSALTNLSLVLVPYRALERGAWIEFLERLTDKQISLSQPADAVVFIGNRTHFSRKPPKKLMEKLSPGGPRFFYFEYHLSATTFPDAIDYLTRELHGTVFRINTPNDLGIAIRKMLTQLGQSSRPSITRGGSDVH